MASLKKNYLYNIALTVSSYIFPLLVFPYVTRILGVHSFGICNFVDSIIQYFVLFSFLGMQTMATREIAKVKDSPLLLKSTFNSLLCLNCITTIVALLVLYFSILVIPKFETYKFLLLIGSAKILSNTLMVEWFYIGTENFKYITIRSLIVRSIYVLSVFLLVKRPTDYILYFGLTISMFVFNALINIVNIKKYTSFSFKNLNVRAYVRPFIILGLYQVLTSMYTTFNVAYLGFVSGETEVGFYTVATKIFTVLLGVFTAFTGVMLPRLSFLIEQGAFEEFKRKITSSVDVLLAFSSPIIIMVAVYAPTLIHIIAGNNYAGSILPLRMIIPLILVIGYEQILVLQILTPLNKDKAILLNSLIGAIVGIIFNILLVHRFRQIGSALVWFFSEISVLSIAQYFVYKYIRMSFPFKIYGKYIYCAIPFLGISYFIKYYLGDSLFSFFFSALIAVSYFYIVYVFVLKNQTVINIHREIAKRFKKCTF